MDELYERIARRGYMFRTVGAKLVRSDFTVESRELSFPSARAGREAISLSIPQLADRFSYGAPGSGDIAVIRKVGLRVTNLSARQEAQKTLLDFTLDGQQEQK